MFLKKSSNRLATLWGPNRRRKHLEKKRNFRLGTMQHMGIGGFHVTGHGGHVGAYNKRSSLKFFVGVHQHGRHDIT